MTEDKPNFLRPLGISRRDEIVAQLDIYEREEWVVYKKQQTAEAKSKTKRTKAGRKRMPRGMARIRLAAEMGLKVSSMIKYDTKPAIEPKLIRRIHYYGVTVNDEHAANLTAMALEAQILGRRMGQIARAIEVLRTGPMPTGSSKLLEISDALRAVSKSLSDWGPRCLCPYCKGQSAGQAGCQECMGLGWQGKRTKIVLPRRLIVEGASPMYMHRGKMIPAREGVGDE